jgi:hypothetical protein
MANCGTKGSFEVVWFNLHGSVRHRFTTEPSFKSRWKMKVSLRSVLIAAALFTASGAAFSQPTDNTSQGTNSNQYQPPMTQPSGSMNSNDSRGPQWGGSTASGRSRNGAPCIVGLSCDIYQGS